MPNTSLILAAWVIILAAAAAYALRARHPDIKPFAAVLIFATAFSAAALVLLFAVAALAAALALERQLETPAGVLVHLLLVFVPAFLLGRWALKRPPRRPPPQPD